MGKEMATFITHICDNCHRLILTDTCEFCGKGKKKEFKPLIVSTLIRAKRTRIKTPNKQQLVHNTT